MKIMGDPPHACEALPRQAATSLVTIRPRADSWPNTRSGTRTTSPAVCQATAPGGIGVTPTRTLGRKTHARRMHGGRCYACRQGRTQFGVTPHFPREHPSPRVSVAHSGAALRGRASHVPTVTCQGAADYQGALPHDTVSCSLPRLCGALWAADTVWSVQYHEPGFTC